MADWALQEVDLIIADYMSMLASELAGIPYSKTDHRRGLAPLLDNRSDGSIEFKHCNISAVLRDMGLPFIKGYKPRFNVQHLLVQRCEEYMQTHQLTIEPVVQHFVEEMPLPYGNLEENILLIEDPPERKEAIDTRNERKARSPFKADYLEREQNNRMLGHVGEEMVIAFEKRRLIKEGSDRLIDQIQWVSEHDDGAGFDILSFEKNGRDRYIEVKTTKLSKETPIYFSQREYEFSCDNSSQYHLYRVFNVNEVPSMFMLNGSFDTMCRKEAIQYRGLF